MKKRGKPLKLTRDEFIQKSVNIHGDKYCYDFVDYKGQKYKVKIFCKKCKKIFEQLAESHIMGGNGCKRCAEKIDAINRTITHDDFIQNAMEIHGDIFDYSETIYKNPKTKIIVRCNACKCKMIANPWWHINYGACNRCKRKKDFLEKATKKYGEIYSYDDVDYQGSNIKTQIHCNRCSNNFKITPNSFLSGHGCGICAKNTKLTHEKKRITNKEFYHLKFIEKAYNIHGNKYDYSLVDYIDGKQKIKIKCNKCNDIFEQSPVLHLRTYGCKCMAPKRTSSKLSTTEKFIERAKIVHGDVFSYGESIYINARTKIKVFCNLCENYIHVIPDGFLNRGTGCIKCSNIETGNRCRFTREEYIEKAKRIHGSKYDYTLVDYKNSNEKIIIICNNCDRRFEQAPSNHIGKSNMNGCPFCISSSFEKIIAEWLKNNKLKFKQEKTFKTCKNPETNCKLRFDFFIKPNILLEYNGKQHYEPSDFFGGEKVFKKTKERDLIKVNWAKENDYIIHIIRYDENLIERLESIFKINAIYNSKIIE